MDNAPISRHDPRDSLLGSELHFLLTETLEFLCRALVCRCDGRSSFAMIAQALFLPFHLSFKSASLDAPFAERFRTWVSLQRRLGEEMVAEPALRARKRVCKIAFLLIKLFHVKSRSLECFARICASAY